MKMLIDTKSKSPYDSFALAIKSIWLILFRGAGKILLLGLVTLLSTNLAIADPSRASCEDGVGGCVNALLDQQTDMIDSLDGLVDDMDTAGIFALVREGTGSDMQETLKNRIANLRNEHARGRAVNELTTDEEYDAMLTQGDNETGKNCKNSDLAFYNALQVEQDNTPNPVPAGLLSVEGDNFGNGKCDIFDAVDEDGNDVRVNERKENMCAQLCSVKENRGGQNKDRFLGRMGGATTSGRNLAQNLSSQRATISQLGVSLSHLQSLGDIHSTDTDDTCVVIGDDHEAALRLEAGFIGAIAILNGTATAGAILTEILDTTNDVADHACGQDVLGNNAKVACTAFTVAFHISNGITETIKNIATNLGDAKDVVGIIADISDATNKTNSLACSKEIRDQFVAPEGKIIKLQSDVAELKGNMGTLKESGDASNDALAELKEQMTQLQQIIETNQELLLTPFGARNNLNKN